MRICLVSREFVPFWGAGIGTYASQMAAAWGAAGHEVHVLSAPHRRLLEDGPTVRPGVQFHVADRDAGQASWDAYRFDFLRHSMAVQLKLLELEQQKPFDYIEFPEYFGEGYFSLRARQTLGHFANAVIGVRLHTPTEVCRALNQQAWLNEEIAWLEHAEDESMRLADVLVSPSGSLLEKVRTRAGFEHKAGAVVPYPSDVQQVRRELGLADDRRPVKSAGGAEVLFFGRMERRKGVHLLIEAGQQLLEAGVPVRFRLIGGDTPSGRSRHGTLHYLKRLIRSRWQKSFVFEPARGRDRLGEAIRAATLCCFPSLWENFPNACLEAMAVGAPVVGSDAGGMAEIIEDQESGLLFGAGDASDLARVLRGALEDESLRKKISERAPGRIAELCDPVGVVRQMESVIGTAASAARGPAVVTTPGSTGAGDATASPLVSIIIPHYNLARYLPETIGSAQKQTFSDCEIIVVDDGSTDAESVELIDRIEGGHLGSVRVVRQENGGLAAARNAGIERARGAWIVPLDADDLLAPSFVADALIAASRDPDLAMVTSLVCHFRERWDDIRAGWVPLGFDRDILPWTNCASCCTALIRRQAILDVGGYDTWFEQFEDWELYCRLAARDMRAAVIPRFLIGYRNRAGSMLRLQDPAIRGHLRAAIYQRHAHIAQNPDRTVRLQFAEAGHHDESRAREIIRENIRYRVADSLNETLKKMGIQSQIKRLTRRINGRV